MLCNRRACPGSELYCDSKLVTHFAYEWLPGRLLLQHGADPNASDKTGWTPLHFTCLVRARFWMESTESARSFIPMLDVPGCRVPGPFTRATRRSSSEHRCVSLPWMYGGLTMSLLLSAQNPGRCRRRREPALRVCLLGCRLIVGCCCSVRQVNKLNRTRWSPMHCCTDTDAVK